MILTSVVVQLPEMEMELASVFDQHEPDVTSSDDLAPEIWDDDSEPDIEQEGGIFPTQQGRMIQYCVLSYFLLFFQLCYHVSDRDFNIF